jgi:hypothetical protein
MVLVERDREGRVGRKDERGIALAPVSARILAGFALRPPEDIKPELESLIEEESLGQASSLDASNVDGRGHCRFIDHCGWIVVGTKR